MKHILVVDDNKTNLAMAKQELMHDYQVTPVISGMQALQFLEKKTPDLILLDINMPEMDGLETLRRIRENNAWSKIPIIFLTAESNPETESECLELGAEDFIAKPFVPRVMRSRISRILELEELRNDLETRLAEKTRQVERVTLQSIMAIAGTIDERDAYTKGHSVRVAKCAEEIARRLGWDAAALQNLHYTALLHDIGNIGVPDSILNKPDKLTDEEFAVIKKHSAVGSDILKDIKMIENVGDGALYHHERYDGTGYPSGRAGEDIPLAARIICVADAYDAMTSNRVYRPKLSRDGITEQFISGAGSQFDPELCRVFVEMLDEGFTVQLNEEDEGGTAADESGMLLHKVLSEYTTDIKSRASTDVLTGLYNRAYTEAAVDKLMREGTDGALFMIDMDNFKHINDTYGHIAGDKTLKLFADTLRAAASECDIVCRIGGDEFVAFFSGLTDRTLISEKASEIINGLSTRLHELGYDSVTSVSIGISISPTDGERFSTLYNTADKSLYYVKKNGKNSYHFYSEETDSSAVSDGVLIDINNIREMIEGDRGAPSASGAFRVDYDDFRKLYSFLSLCVNRSRRMVQTVLFTLDGAEDRFGTEELQSAMKLLEAAVATSLRSVDVGTQYSSCQYIVLLTDANSENGRMVAGRVEERYLAAAQSDAITLKYDIQEMLPRMKS